MLLFTRHYFARRFGMYMPKSRDIQAKIPLPQAIWNEFWFVAVNGVNSNDFIFHSKYFHFFLSIISEIM